MLGLMIKEASSNLAGRGVTTGVVITGFVVVDVGEVVETTGGVVEIDGVVVGGIGVTTVVVVVDVGAGATAFTP